MEEAGYTGYYYRAAVYELGHIEKKPLQKQIEDIQAFLDEQEDENYMLYLAADYVEAGEEKKASKLCKKLIRLFQNGESVEYAKRFLDAIGDGKATGYLGSQRRL